MSKTESSDRRGSLLGRWKDRIKEYMSERDTGRVREDLNKKRGNAWIGRGGDFCHGHLLRGAPGGGEESDYR